MEAFPAGPRRNLRPMGRSIAGSPRNRLPSHEGRPLQKLAPLPLACALAATLHAPAWGEETASTRSALAARGVDRPYTMAQLGVGLLTLPAADVCLRSRPCTKGDTSIEIDFWQMYRESRRFAIGA